MGKPKRYKGGSSKNRNSNLEKMYLFHDNILTLQLKSRNRVEFTRRININNKKELASAITLIINKYASYNVVDLIQILEWIEKKENDWF